MPISPDASSCMATSCPGRPRRWPASAAECSIGSATRSRAPPRSCATTRTAASRRTSMAAARSSSCSTACSRTSTATSRPAIYVRNPPQSRHTPGSAPGCTILVKLWQFDPEDRSHVRIDTGKIGAVPERDRPGVAVTPLFKDSRRTSGWSIGSRAPRSRSMPRAGRSCSCSRAASRKAATSCAAIPGCVCRMAQGSIAKAGPEGAVVWIKSGHLRFVDRPPRA